jgi:hypothetical protein
MAGDQAFNPVRTVRGDGGMTQLHLNLLPFNL